MTILRLQGLQDSLRPEVDKLVGYHISRSDQGAFFIFIFVYQQIAQISFGRSIRQSQTDICRFCRASLELLEKSRAS